jgi:Zn-dependent protease with chaperone function
MALIAALLPLVSLSLAWHLAARQQRHLDTVARGHARREVIDSEFQRLRHWRRRVAVDHLLFLGLCPSGVAGYLLTDGPFAALVVAAAAGLLTALRDVSVRPERLARPLDTAAGVVPVVAGVFLASLVLDRLGWIALWAAWGVTTLVVKCWLPRRFHGASPPAPAMARRLNDLCRRAGEGAVAWLVAADGANASATGGWPWRTIILGGDLVSSLSAAELEAVAAHELGHLRGRHRLRYYGLAVLAGLPAFSLVEQAVPSPVGPAHGGAQILWLLLAAPVLQFLLAPVAVSCRRRLELEADAFAARVADPGKLASALQQMASDGDPSARNDRLFGLFHYGYPDLAHRIGLLTAPRPIPAAATGEQRIKRILHSRATGD